MTVRRLLALVAGLLAVLAAGCSSGGIPSASPSPVPTFTPSATTPTPAESPTSAPGTPTPTVAPLPKAVATALANVAAVRELSAPPTLRVNVIPRSELPELLDSLITAHDRELLARTTTLYRLLGHFNDQQDYLSLYLGFGATGILGLYSPADDALWVVSDSGTAGLENLSRPERETLAHELVHAIQDHHYSLDTTYLEVEDNLDRSLAYTSVIEGDAVTHEEIYSERFIARPFAGRALLVGVVSSQLGEIPPSFIRELLFPYTTGASWVRSLRERSGVAAINAYLQDPPSSTAVVLHPELESQGFRPTVVSLPDLAPSLGSAWVRESGGTLGEFQWRNYLQLALSSSSASAAAAGWAGDHYDVYTSPGGSAAAFAITFATDDEAAAFVETHGRFLAARAKDSANEGNIRIVRTAESRYTATMPAQGVSVRFAIATTRDAAVTAVRVISAP